MNKIQEEKPGEEELWHVLLVQAQPWIPVQCLSVCAVGNVVEPMSDKEQLIPPSLPAAPCGAEGWGGSAGSTARELVRAVFTRRGFSKAEIPAGICQAALPGKAAEVSLQQLRVCLSLPASLPGCCLPIPADPGPRHALKADQSWS